jgi:hypothetical protein
MLQIILNFKTLNLRFLQVYMVYKIYVLLNFFIYLGVESVQFTFKIIEFELIQL